MGSSQTNIVAAAKESQHAYSTAGRWNLSNILSLGRLLLVLPTGVAVWYDAKWIAVTLFVLAAISDYLDGYFARRLGQVSDFGKILDPLADKVYVAGVILLLLFLNVLPLWLVGPILLRDLLILLGGIYVERKVGVVLPSNWTGKWAVGALSLTILLIYLGVEGIVVQSFIALTFLMLFLSLLLYARRMVAVLKGKEDGGAS